ncbi:hypothetical protein IV203_014578 [Nitzschia inconspicua]|uniref:Uncharacterized protein n=1 Tax=Nitzschia inconspicua TaxID=303405 RepID=A0A9K3LC50_9STRA|nr:hypothetical protein IV203_014578 [Nitzschia inconspicua]
MQTAALLDSESYGFGAPEWLTRKQQKVKEPPPPAVAQQQRRRQQQQQQQKNVNDHWTIFSSEHQVQWHNSSTDGRTIPGPYW